MKVSHEITAEGYAAQRNSKPISAILTPTTKYVQTPYAHATQEPRPACVARRWMPSSAAVVLVPEDADERTGCVTSGMSPGDA
jgi:hypothetical protein